MIPGTTASHTGPGIRWVIHNTPIPGQANAGNAMFASGKYIFQATGAGVVSFDSLSMTDGTTRYSNATMEWTTNTINAVPSFSNGLYIYPTDGVNTAGPKVSSTLGGTLVEVPLEGSRCGVYATRASRWIIVGGAGAVATSTNGTTWSVSSPAALNIGQLHSVAASPGCTILGSSSNLARNTSTLLTDSSWSVLATGSIGARGLHYEPSIATWMAGGSNGAYGYSTNDGVSWTSKVIHSTAVNASGITFYRGNWYVGNSIGEIWRSETSDPAGTWVKVFTIPTNIQVRVVNVSGASNPILFTGTTAGGLTHMSV
jgi:hypothetical protein